MKPFNRVTVFALFLYLVLFPFGQLTRLPLSFLGPDIKVYLTDIVVGVIGLAGWLEIAKNRKLSKLLWPIFSFTLIALLSLLANIAGLSLSEAGVSLLYWVRWVAYAGFFFFITSLYKQKAISRLRISHSLLALGAASAIFGLIQFSLWPNLRPLEALNWDPHFYRVVGAFLDPGFTGLILALTFLRLFEKTTDKRTGFLIGSLVIFALALTYSRSSYLALWVGSFILSLLKKTAKPLLLVSGILAAVIFFLPRPAGKGGELGRTYSIEARVESWRHAWEIIGQKPLTGVGFNSYRYAQRDRGYLNQDWQANHAGSGADSSLLFVWATTGVFGLFSYLWIWSRLARIALKRKEPSFLVALGAVFFHALFLNSLFYPWVMGWLWLEASMVES